MFRQRQKHQMKKVLTSNKIPLETRIRILKCYVWSTLQYGAETWTIGKAMCKRLSAFELWTYRRILKISWKDKITNEDVLKRVNAKNRLIKIIQTKKLKYFGHISRQNGSSLHRIILDGKVDGTKSRGRPRTSWSSNVVKWTGLLYHQAVRIAQNRKEWRAIASNPQQEDGT